MVKCLSTGVSLKLKTAAPSSGKRLFIPIFLVHSPAAPVPVKKARRSAAVRSLMLTMWQRVFLAPEYTIPPGCRIVIAQDGMLRDFIFLRRGDGLSHSSGDRPYQRGDGVMEQLLLRSVLDALAPAFSDAIIVTEQVRQGIFCPLLLPYFGKLLPSSRAGRPLSRRCRFFFNLLPQIRGYCGFCHCSGSGTDRPQRLPGFSAFESSIADDSSVTMRFRLSALAFRSGEQPVFMGKLALSPLFRKQGVTLGGPYGSGTFLVQNKVRAGAYIRFRSVKQSFAAVGSRGIAALPLKLGFGPVGTLVEVNADTDIRKTFGYDPSDTELLLLRECANVPKQFWFIVLRMVRRLPAQPKTLP